MNILQKILSWFFLRNFKPITNFISPTRSFTLTFTEGWFYKIEDSTISFVCPSRMNGALIFSSMVKEKGVVDIENELLKFKEEYPKSRVIEIGNNQVLERLAQFPKEGVLEYHYYFYRNNRFVYCTYTFGYMSDKELDREYSEIIEILKTLKIN